MLGNADELIWLDTLRMTGLQLRFCRQPGQWVFDVAYNFHPKKDKLAHLPEYEYTKYFSLMSYLVYYPLMWYLENFSRVDGFARLSAQQRPWWHHHRRSRWCRQNHHVCGVAAAGRHRAHCRKSHFH